MRRLITLVAVLSLYVSAHAQPMAAYDFATSKGTYEELSGGTVVSPGAADAYPIGFEFKYDNARMNRFKVLDGLVFLGRDDVPLEEVPDDNFYVFNNEDYKDFIGVSMMSGIKSIDGTEISYKVTGAAPDRVLVVQYKNIGANMDRWDENYKAVQMQIRLHETTGKVDIVFDGWYPDNSDMPAYLSTRVGIKGTGKDLLTAVTGFNEPEASTGIGSISWNNDSYPADGLTYTFAPPADCEAPAAQPTALLTEAGSTAISGSFTPSAMADHYLVLLSGSKTLTAMPADGTFYTAGQTVGGAQVLQYSGETTFATGENLKGATGYTLFVFAANSACMFGPKYLTAAPLTATVRTMPDGPTALAVTDAQLTDVTLSAEGNDAGDNVIIAVTTEPLYNTYGQMIEGGTFGTPDANATVGSDIEGGGRVIYRGQAKSGIVADGLEENSVYHFAVWSVDADGNCSTTSLMASTSTGGRLPYAPPFSKMPPYNDAPPGWDVEGFAMTQNSSTNDTLISVRVANQNAVDGTVSYATTPWIQLGEGDSRVVMDVNMTEYVMWSNNPYNDWADGDQLKLQISTDGKTFEDIYIIGKDKAPKFADVSSFVRLYAPFSAHSGEKVKLRIYWKTFRAPTLNIKNILVEEKADCDYPINLRTAEGSVVSDKAAIDWDRQGNENAWELRWRVAGTGEWSEPVAVSAKPYTMSGLSAISDIEVEARAVCDAATASRWSDTFTFRSGYALPFTETLDVSTLPDGWELKSGALASPTAFDGEPDGWQWMSSYRLKGLIFSPGSVTEYNDWAITPRFDLGDGSVNYIVTVKLQQAGAGTSTDETYRLLVSRDGAGTFSEADVVATASPADAEGGVVTLTATLRKYTGLGRAAVYVTSSDGSPSTLMLTEISVIETCPTDIAGITVADVTPTSVKASWTTAAESSLVFIRKQGDSAKPYTKTAETAMTFDNLEPRTDYEIGITKMCEEGDTARVTIVRITTPAEEGCPMPENIKAVAGKYESTLSWTGEATAYDVRYRKAADSGWTETQTRENTVTLTGLEPSTEYVYSLRSRCSTLDDDMSDWTDELTFTTLDETCHTPEAITVVPSYATATVTWTGESDKYELAYREQQAEEWTTATISGATSYTIEGLKAETAYSLRLRSVCSDTDMSRWSAELGFSTTAVPECVTPTDLSVSALTATSARLSWKGDEGNLRWNLRYRKGTDASWTTEEGLTETVCELTGLDADASYIWSVMAECEAKNSNWAAQSKFSTAATGIGGIDISGTRVFVRDRVLNIVNPDRGYIGSVTLYTAGGKAIKTYAVDASDNVFIPLGAVQERVAIVAISGKNGTRTVKLRL